MSDAELPIGVFDSGVGGLTVMRSIIDLCPHESILYLGDTARVPYGTRSPKTVIQYANQCAHSLLKRGIKVLIVACNTASAHALEVLQGELPIPVLGVVEPGAQAAADLTRNRKIGVLGTRGTISSGEYPRALQARLPSVDVFCVACPLFVPLAEEGWVEGDVPKLATETYLRSLLDEGIDTLILGCTHYPLLHDTIADVAGTEVQLVDSALATAKAVQEVLDAMDLSAPKRDPEYRYLVTDAPDTFRSTGETFLGRPLHSVEWIDLN